jgi:chaperonin GroES
MKKIIPRKKQILVKPDGDESRMTESGLYKPDTVEQEKKAVGTVVAVGPDVKDIKKGDRVIYGIFAGDPISLDGKDYKFVDEEFVLGFLKE